MWAGVQTTRWLRCGPLVVLLAVALWQLLPAALTAASSMSPLLACSLTFAQWEQLAGPLVAYRTAAHTCPSDCPDFIAAADNSTAGARVRGSYPYSRDSAICLAAVHCGLVNATLGGSVFPSRFYRHDWSGGASQSIFPFNSSQGSRSNGVLSVDVPASFYSVPSNGSEYSSVVRGRGELVRQRREAPFPPRWGHAHVGYPLYTMDSSASTPARVAYRNYHLIVGGFNGTTYLNDVWVAEPSDLLTNSDLQWRRLPDAPFTPRADMRTTVVWEDEIDYLTSSQLVHVLFIGGQTSHRCGLVELGVCSNEVFDLQLNLSLSFTRGPQVFHVQSYSWASNGQPFALLPFPARCGPGLTSLNQAPTLALVGGQVSYDDNSCASPPTVVNDVWLNDRWDERGHVNLSVWRRDADAPFSPRRSQQREDTLATVSQRQQTALDSQQLQLGCCPLVGGFRILNLTHTQRPGQHHPATAAVRIDALEVYADAWVCNANFSSGTSPFVPPTCRWGWTRPSSAPLPPSPTTSVPIPTAFAANAAMRGFWAQAGQRFTGFTSQAAVEGWTGSQPASPSATATHLVANWTAMLRNAPDGSFGLSDEEIAQQRMGLPSAFVLGTELLENNTSYTAGTVWVQSHQPWVSPPAALYRADVTLPSLTTLHPQRFSLAAEPADASAFLPLATSSRNTSRPHFRFPLARLEAAYDEWSDPIYDPKQFFDALLYTVGTTVVSGGRVNGQPLSDWIELGEVRCLPPDDPSFVSLLGPVELLNSSRARRDVADASYTQKDVVHIQCRVGFHFEPPLLRGELQTTASCAPNGLWLDLDLLRSRPCVGNPPLNCSAGLVDLGGEFCEPPRPFVTSIDVVSEDAPLHSSLVRRVDDVTLLDFPVTADTPLRIEGSNFTKPLSVTVGGHSCAFAQLAGRLQNLCYNTSAVSGSGQREVVESCAVFGSAITCVVPAVLGLNLAVLVQSGPLGFSADVPGGELATLSSTAPVIMWLGAYVGAGHTTQLNGSRLVCDVSGDQLRLSECPVQRSYNLSVCVLPETVYHLPLSVFLGASRVSLPCQEELGSTTGTAFGYRCVRCQVLPFLGTQQVRVQPVELPLLSRSNASISSSSCPPGFRTDFQALSDGGGTDLCIPCEAGSSTRGAGGASACVTCRAGEYAAQRNASDCALCEPGSYAPDSGSTSCLPCPVNSYQSLQGSIECTRCVDSYMVFGAEGWASGKCWDCPAYAACSVQGVISAAAATFLVIEQDSATVSSFPCSASACVHASSNSTCQHAQLVHFTEVEVQNCCAAGRYPAYSPDWQGIDDLQATEGVNVLCALCLDGYAEVNGDCIPCESTNAGLVCAVLLFLLASVYALHRLPHEQRGKATVLILGYFVQQSAMFLSPSFFVVGVVNFDLLGGSGTQRSSRGDGQAGVPHPHLCVVPLHSDAERIVGALLVQLLVFFLPSVIAVVQLVCFCLLRRAPPRLRMLRRAYRLVFKANAPEPLPPFGPQSMLLEPLRLNPDANPETDAGAARPSPNPSASIELRTRDAEGSGSSSLMEACAASWLTYQRTMVRLMLLSYTSIALLTLRFFHTRSIGSYGSRVMTYPALDPASTVYTRRLLPVMLLLLILVLLVPWLLAFFLWRLRRRSASDAQRAMADGGEPVQKTWKAALLVQLCGMFRADTWWMAPFIGVRRLLLAAVFAFVPSQTVFIWLTLANQLILALHLQLQPFRRRRDNVLESVCLLLLCIQTSLLGAIPTNPAGSAPLTSVLSLLVLAPILMALCGGCARKLWLRLRAHLARWAMNRSAITAEMARG